MEAQRAKAANAISVVVPVYNAEATLGTLTARLSAVLAAIATDYEIIFVNDSSPDSSWRVIQDLCARDEHVRGINLMRNFGQHNGLLCGIRAARFEFIVTLDDDLQHPPEEIPKLLDELNRGADVVYGAPEQQQHGFLRNLASEFTKVALQGAMGASTARHVSAFRIFRTRLRKAFADYHSPFLTIDVLLTWGTTRFSVVRVRHDPRFAGRSNYTFSKLVRHALTLMTGFSVWPLELASLAGFLFMFLGIVILGYVVARYFLDGGSVPGFPFLASVIVIFSGAQMFALGIIGEYLARMHHRMMERPVYVVAETAGTETPPPSRPQ